MGQKNVTVKDIARLAGVSTATVSYVLNNNPNQTISEETAGRVREAVKALHYVPNNLAKSLRKQRTECIGIALGKNLTTLRVASTLQGIRRTLEKEGYMILLCPLEQEGADAEGPPSYLRFFRERKIDGIIYLSYDGRSIPPEIGSQIVQEKIPAVILGTEDSGRISTVEYDYYGGARQHVRYLAGKQVERILYLYPDMDNRQERERLKGVMDAAAAFPRLSLQTVPVPYCYEELEWLDREATGTSGRNARWVEERIEKSIEPFLAGEDRITEADAVVCSWGGWTETVFFTCLRHRIMPFIAGLASGSLFGEGYEKISYSRLPSYEAGAVCARQVLKQIEGVSRAEHCVLEVGMALDGRGEQISD